MIPGYFAPFCVILQAGWEPALFSIGIERPQLLYDEVPASALPARANNASTFCSACIRTKKR